MGPCCSKKEEELEGLDNVTPGQTMTSQKTSGTATTSRGLGRGCDILEEFRVAKISTYVLDPESLAVSIFATDVRTLADIQIVDVRKDQHLTTAFLSKNPMHTVPTIELQDGFVMAESVASLRFLTQTAYRRSFFYPTDEEKLRARVDWAMAATQNTVRPKWRARMGHVLGFARAPEDPGKANRELKDVLDKFTATFVSSDERFICGDLVTIADYCILPYVYPLTRSVVEQKLGIKLSQRLQEYVRDVMSASANAEIFLGMSPNNMASYMDGCKKDLPDFEGPITICGEKLGGGFSKGSSKFDEKQAKVWGIAASTNAASATLIVRDAGQGDLWPCPSTARQAQEWKSQLSKRNPFHNNPTYEGSDGMVIGETGPILRYVAENSMPHLYPSEKDQAKTRGLIDWAMDVVDCRVIDTLGYGVVFPLLGFAAPPANQPEANARCGRLLDEFAACFLKGRKFVAGPSVSIAEYRLVPLLYAASLEEVEEATGFKLPARMAQYLQESLAAIESSEFLYEADGHSIREYIQKRRGKQRAYAPAAVEQS